VAKLCLCLTAPTIEENLKVLERYRSIIDLVELRVDFLRPEEYFYIRRFPELAHIPSILTVRRYSDGGQFKEGEAVRLVIIAKALAFASNDKSKNFSYVDIEHDMYAPALQEATCTFGTKVIRSYHAHSFPDDIDAIWKKISENHLEIPKLSVLTESISDTEKILRYFSARPKGEHRIIVGMGSYGFCTRILTDITGSMLMYASASHAGLPLAAPGQLDPEILVKIYRINQHIIHKRIYGIIGSAAVVNSLSPYFHNAGFALCDENAVYLPFPVDSIENFLSLADFLNIHGFSVTVPHKEKIIHYLSEYSPEVKEIGACNTVIRTKQGLIGYNTDGYGFEKAIIEFTGSPDLSSMSTTIVGAGGAARAIAYVIHKLGGKACIINRNMNKARKLAETYGFPWAGITEHAVNLVNEYNDLIIQATPVGMNGGEPGDPLEWYDFKVLEMVFDTIYSPAETPMLERARKAGCRTMNGLSMLKWQAVAQFELFTEKKFPDIDIYSII